MASSRNSQQPTTETFSDLVDEVKPLRNTPHSPTVRPRPKRPSVQIQQELPPAEFRVLRDTDVVMGCADGTAWSVAEALARGPQPPTRTLDLHNHSAGEAKHSLRQHLLRASEDGVRAVLVIVGKGIRSGQEGPILPELVVGELSGNLASRVVAFRSAPPRWGGAGALIVLLRRQKKWQR